MFQSKVLTIFHEVSEYFRSFLRISHEFYVFDLDQSFLFFISLSFRVKSVIAAPPHGEIWNTLLTILERYRYFS